MHNLKSKNNTIYYIDKKINLEDKSFKKINFDDLNKIKLETLIIMNHSKETLKYNWKNYYQSQNQYYLVKL